MRRLICYRARSFARVTCSQALAAKQRRKLATANLGALSLSFGMEEYAFALQVGPCMQSTHTQQHSPPHSRPLASSICTAHCFPCAMTPLPVTCRG